MASLKESKIRETINLRPVDAAFQTLESNFKKELKENSDLKAKLELSGKHKILC